MIEKTDIGDLKGIGEKTKKLFEKINIHTVGDLIRYYPHGYDVYEEAVPVSELEEDKIQTVTGAIYGRVQVSGSSRMQVTTLYVKDIIGTLKVIWFRMPFLRNTLSGGGVITLRGRVVRKKTGDLVMEHPEIFYPSAKYEEKLHTLQPVYGLTSGLSNNMVMKAMKQALDGLDLTREILPDSLRLKYGLAEYNYAVRGIHFPEDKEVFYHARERLVFEEFLEFILSIRRLKEKNERLENNYPMQPRPEVETFLKSLPFELTGAQTKVWKEIEKDLGSEKTMSRLVQGDVGSGKTIVAVLALMNAAFNGCQGAMMAPTEVLAVQHFEALTEMTEKYGLCTKPILLTGSMTSKQKKEAYARIKSGDADVIIGTHALIQDKVEYRDLALVVTDEQHRFGVRQRECLANKGEGVHVLVMSATPIPRTLAIVLYGDLEVSVLDEMPKNRLPIKNCVVDPSFRKKAYAFLEAQVEAGHQVYVICPMVEAGEDSADGLENVTDYTEKLKAALNSSIRVAALHGKMKAAQKQEIMDAFGAGQIDVLVSTTVIEVGINVPNATVMLVENAERFGLAQLHQLRGRVGRGHAQSFCIFMTGDGSGAKNKRLDVLNHSNDGFFIANEDLKLRGPGDLFGIRQSGDLDFGLGDIYQDSDVLMLAGELADQVLSGDVVLPEKEFGLFEKSIDYRTI